MAPHAYLEETQVRQPPYVFLPDACPCVERCTFVHDALPPVVFLLDVAQCTVVTVAETRDYSVRWPVSSRSSAIDSLTRTLVFFIIGLCSTHHASPCAVSPLLRLSSIR